MFSYYGSKSKIIHLYPEPKFNNIIEPFAGSARYSLRYWDRDILLVDKYDILVNVWKYLQCASESDILKLPKMRRGDDIREYGLSQEETLFLGFLSAGGVSAPQWTVSMFGEYEHGNQNVYKRIAGSLYKIRHWKIICADYQSIENQEATWFIDPPYFAGGDRYFHSQIDYSFLAEWCKSREGQVIVCENTSAAWLPFKPMVKIQGAKSKNTTEAVWINHTGA